MPVFQVNGQLCYFAHVPKCAGTSVEHYLRRRFGELGLQDNAYLKPRPTRRWSKSSPQHIDAAALNRLLPPSYFRARFALVRHPGKRLLSVFMYQRDIEKKLPVTTGFGAFLADLERRWRRNPFYLDNHPRPMSDLVPDDCTVFHLENGIGAVVDWLDALAGDSHGPRAIPSMNSYRRELYHRRLEPGPDTRVSAEERAQIADIYAADFERFGYDPEGDAMKGMKP